MEYLSQREEQILLAIGYLREDAYLVAIRKHLSAVMGRELSIGAVHIPLRRIEKQGLITASFGESTAVRGGRRKKIYRLTSAGLEALEGNKKVSDRLWADYLKTKALSKI
ncbi:MAG: helix-turn-helix transcriptional regulator [Candidatus Aminicenantes bacterium]|nr:MAG: helix-turn-helix transcriptional regulator [Candidatus Aminicenantes bacterium]